MPRKAILLVAGHLGDRVPEQDELVVGLCAIILAGLGGANGRHAGWVVVFLEREREGWMRRCGGVIDPGRKGKVDQARIPEQEQRECSPVTR